MDRAPTQTRPRPGRAIRGARWLLPLLAIVLFGAVLLWYALTVVVTVENVGDAAIENVVLRLGDDTCDVGAIGPGESETVHVIPRGESIVELFWEHGGQRHEDAIGGYVSFGSHGSIDVSIAGGEVVSLAGSKALPMRVTP